MNRNTELDRKSVTSEPASPVNSAGEEKMEDGSELSSPTFHSGDSGFFERGIKTMLSIRKSKRSPNKEKGKEGTGSWKGKRLSLRFSKSYEGNKTTTCNGAEDISEDIAAELIQGKPLSGKKQNHQCNLLGRIHVTFKQFYTLQVLGPTGMLKNQASHYRAETTVTPCTSSLGCYLAWPGQVAHH